MDGRFIRIGERCETSMRGVYAIGDVTGEPMLAHRAMAQGEMVAEIVAGLPRAWDTTVRALSGGNRRKVERARALLHKPALILMDGPTVGLDPKSRRDLLEAITQQVRGHQRMVLWATHLVEETLQADRVLVLNRGQLVADGSPEEVRQQLGAATLEQGFIEITQTARSPGNPQAKEIV